MVSSRSGQDKMSLLGRFGSLTQGSLWYVFVLQVVGNGRWEEERGDDHDERARPGRAAGQSRGNRTDLGKEANL